MVSTIAAIDAAFCRPARVTLAGSMMPAAIRSTHLAGCGVHAHRTSGGLDLADDDGTFEAGVVGDVAGRRGRAPPTPSWRRSSRRLRATRRPWHRLAGPDQGGAATGDHTLFDGCTDRRHGVFDAVLLLLELDLGGGADLDQRHTAGQLGETLLELLTIPVGVGVLDLGLDLVDPARRCRRASRHRRRWWCCPW